MTWSAVALASGCCAPGGSAVPSVLGPEERLAAGVVVSGSADLGAFTWDGRWVANPGVDAMGLLELVGLARLGRRAQLGLGVPVTADIHQVGGLSSTGFGLGAVGAHARWDADPVNCGEWSLRARPSLTVGLAAPPAHGEGWWTPTASALWEGSHPKGVFTFGVTSKLPIGGALSLDGVSSLQYKVSDPVSLRGTARFTSTIKGAASSVAPVSWVPYLGAGVVWQPLPRLRSTFGVEAPLAVRRLGRDAIGDVTVTASVMLLRRSAMSK